MASTEPTWRLVLDAARHLGAGGRSFTREALLREVRRMDPDRGDGTIGPTLQGITANASGGPRSPSGTPLRRVERGVYCLAGEAQEPAGPRVLAAGHSNIAFPELTPVYAHHDDEARSRHGPGFGGLRQDQAPGRSAGPRPVHVATVPRAATG